MAIQGFQRRKSLFNSGLSKIYTEASIPCYASCPNYSDSSSQVPREPSTSTINIPFYANYNGFGKIYFCSMPQTSIDLSNSDFNSSLIRYPSDPSRIKNLACHSPTPMPFVIFLYSFHQIAVPMTSSKLTFPSFSTPSIPPSSGQEQLQLNLLLNSNGANPCKTLNAFLLAANLAYRPLAATP